MRSNEGARRKLLMLVQKDVKRGEMRELGGIEDGMAEDRRIWRRNKGAGTRVLKIVCMNSSSYMKLLIFIV